MSVHHNIHDSFYYQGKITAIICTVIVGVVLVVVVVMGHNPSLLAVL